MAQSKSISYRPFLKVMRGEVVESIHSGAAAVVNRDGELLAWWGNPEVVTYSRSSAKPFQALPLLEAGGREAYGLSPEHIAITCASHSGTDRHVEVLRDYHARVGISEGDLLCGTHPPVDRETAERLIREGIEPTPIRHNCSGKHTGMLALAKLRGFPTSGYIEKNHPVQKLIRSVFSEMCGYSLEKIKLGIDGCSVPVFAVPLRYFARAYARLVDNEGLEAQRAQACSTIRSAMTSHPFLVAGPERFDTRLMEVTGGRLVAKGGAEGFQGVGIPPGAIRPGSPGMGLALKVADGDKGSRARPAFTVEILRQLGALSEEEAGRALPQEKRIIKNWRGFHAGELVPDFRMEGP